MVLCERGGSAVRGRGKVDRIFDLRATRGGVNLLNENQLTAVTVISRRSADCFSSELCIFTEISTAADQIHIGLNFISRSLRGQIGTFFRAERASEFAKAVSLSSPPPFLSLSLIKIRFVERIPPTTTDNVIFPPIVYHELFFISVVCSLAKIPIFREELECRLSGILAGG